MLADYGSVARYCTQHFKRAMVLIPPAIGELEHRNNSAVSCAINSGSEICAGTFAATQLVRPHDHLHILHVREERLVSPGSTDDEGLAAAAGRVRTRFFILLTI